MKPRIHDSNPYCNRCLPERTERAKEGLGPGVNIMEWKKISVWMPLKQPEGE